MTCFMLLFLPLLVAVLGLIVTTLCKHPLLMIMSATHTPTHADSHTHTRRLTHPHVQTHTLTHADSHTHTCRLTHPHMQTHILTHADSHTHTCRLTHSHMQITLTDLHTKWNYSYIHVHKILILRTLIFLMVATILLILAIGIAVMFLIVSYDNLHSEIVCSCVLNDP